MVDDEDDGEDGDDAEEDEDEDGPRKKRKEIKRRLNVAKNVLRMMKIKTKIVKTMMKKQVMMTKSH